MSMPPARQHYHTYTHMYRHVKKTSLPRSDANSIQQIPSSPKLVVSPVEMECNKFG